MAEQTPHYKGRVHTSYSVSIKSIQGSIAKCLASVGEAQIPLEFHTAYFEPFNLKAGDSFEWIPSKDGSWCSGRDLYPPERKKDLKRRLIELNLTESEGPNNNHKRTPFLGLVHKIEGEKAICPVISPGGLLLTVSFPYSELREHGITKLKGFKYKPETRELKTIGKKTNSKKRGYLSCSSLIQEVEQEYARCSLMFGNHELSVQFPYEVLKAHNLVQWDRFNYLLNSEGEVSPENIVPTQRHKDFIAKLIQDIEELEKDEGYQEFLRRAREKREQDLKE